MLEYLSSGKGCFPYEVVTGFDSLFATPEDGDFWDISTFYSKLRDEGISQKEWEGCQKLHKTLKMRISAILTTSITYRTLLYSVSSRSIGGKKSKTKLVSILDVSRLPAA